MPRELTEADAFVIARYYVKVWEEAEQRGLKFQEETGASDQCRDAAVKMIKNTITEEFYKASLQFLLENGTEEEQAHAEAVLDQIGGSCLVK